MNGMKINFKKRGLKQFIVLSAVSTQLLGATQIFAYSNSIGDQSILETSNLGVPQLPTQNQYPEWDSRAYYTVGDRVIYNGQIWEALVSFQGHGDMNWAPAIDSTLWRLIGDVLEPEPDTGLDEASSDGLEYMFTANNNGPQAFIQSFNGTQNNVLIPELVMHEGQSYRVTLIQPQAFANKGIKRVEFASESPLFGFLTMDSAFAGNPLESIHIQPGTSAPLFMSFLTGGMRGVTTETVLYEGDVPTYQWNGNDAWLPIN